MGVPTVNIGDRQKGRIRVPSILDCPPDRESIAEAVRKALDPGFREPLKHMTHPCEKDGTAHRIAETLISARLEGILKKKFHDLGEGV